MLVKQLWRNCEAEWSPNPARVLWIRSLEELKLKFCCRVLTRGTWWLGVTSQVLNTTVTWSSLALCGILWYLMISVITESQHKLRNGKVQTTDPLAAFVQWYDVNTLNCQLCTTLYNRKLIPASAAISCRKVGQRSGGVIAADGLPSPSLKQRRFVRIKGSTCLQAGLAVQIQ